VNEFVSVSNSESLVTCMFIYYYKGICTVQRHILFTGANQRRAFTSNIWRVPRYRPDI